MSERTVLIIGGVAVALVLAALVLRSSPGEWPRRIGNLLPGWPWW